MTDRNLPRKTYRPLGQLLQETADGRPPEPVTLAQMSAEVCNLP